MYQKLVYLSYLNATLKSEAENRLIVITKISSLYNNNLKNIDLIKEKKD